MKKKHIIILIVSIIIIIGIIAGIVYLSMGKAGISRFKKNWESKYQDGIRREILIYNANGDIIFESKGQFDFTYDSECIEYIDTETGLKHNIFTGYNATVIISEIED
ncbi:MAG: hypothetical protein GX053_08180 [Tissierella sp.]|nr:hypothetical protein [Tissierella sp.]